MPLKLIDRARTDGTHVTFVNCGQLESRKTNGYMVNAKEGSALLGWITWHGAWRKYAFHPSAGTIYEETCLRDIAEFCEQETKAHRAKAKEAKA